MIARKYISRSGLAWQVRIKIIGKGYSSKFFSDRAYGGSRGALKAAKLWRDKMCRRNKIPIVDGRQSGPRKASNRTSTGIIGITKGPKFWKGHYYDKEKKKQINKQFSTTVYGEEQAFILACHYRYEKCGKLQIYSNHEFPCDIPVEHEVINEKTI